MTDKELYFYYILYVVISIVTSAPFFMVFFSEYSVFLILSYGLFLILLVFSIEMLGLKKSNILDYSLLWLLPIVVLGLLNILLYPGTRLVPNPSSAPSALVEPAVALFYNGLNPYSIRIFDGAPISPGPGWILLNSPLLLGGLITILTPIYLFFSGFMLAKLCKATHAFIYILLTLVSLNFLQMSIIGHDLPAIILALVGLTLALNLYYKDNIYFIIIAVLIGLVATARVPFVIFPIALSICLVKIDYFRARVFLILSVGITVTVHLIFWIWVYSQGVFYQPLHVIGRATHGGSLIILFFGALIWAMFGWYGWRHLTKCPSTWMFFLWTVLSIPFIFVGINELLSNGLFHLKAWQTWEGKGYVMFTLPLLVAGLVLGDKEIIRAK
ncbi:MAG: hypothetical protein H6972_04500 [Gammaproteobacteria bacterium]|nr:hypothetical protein [Gammaproteobacteria bacterium]